ncbi:MAG: hypothetical protein FWF09_08645, partial [Bacteroidales bacterium]|nr:hypothetical protein [Bacteroidales bacterium]
KGNRKSIVMMPNGSAVVNHADRNYYSMFDANGKFVKEFGITDKSGKRFQKIQPIAGVINNNFFTTLDDMGKMLCFDFNGNYVKTLTLNYSTREIIPMSGNKIVVVGWAIWKDRFRDFVAIVDYQTNEEKIIWEQFTPNAVKGGKSVKMFVYSYRFGDESTTVLTTMPYIELGISSPPKIAFINNQLIVGLPHSGEIMMYDVNGKLTSKERIEWGRNFISVAEQKEIQQKAIEKYSSQENWCIPGTNTVEERTIAIENMLKEMRADLDKITTPIPIPVFSNMIKDSDGNLLFFEMSEKEDTNKFNVWVFQNGGKFVCQSSFECDDYDLSITPSKMVFHNGYIYALQNLKNTTGNPLRLVRFKVGN